MYIVFSHLSLPAVFLLASTGIIFNQFKINTLKNFFYCLASAHKEVDKVDKN